MAKRVTPEEDIARLEERLWRRGKGKIENRADFIGVYDSYLKDSGSRTNKKLQEKVFSLMKKRHPNVSNKVVINAKRMDTFEGLGSKPSPKEFNVIGMSKGRKVFARRVKSVSKKGKTFFTYRDKKGRFVKVTQ